MFRIGSGAGFSGDRIDAPQSVVSEISKAGEGGALIFETLGERTIALGQIRRHRDPGAGYEPLLERFLEPILAQCIESKIIVVGNFGSANPPAAGLVIKRLAKCLGFKSLRIAVIEGDDVLGSIDENQLECIERINDNDEPLLQNDGLVSINVYFGAEAIADAIRGGAQVVVVGRSADPALALGPLLAHFNWAMDDLDLIAAGTLIGHLLECGSQVTGGYFADPGWKDVLDPANLGFPIAEVEANGSCVITKANGTGGLVDTRTVKEQLLYEIHDPAAYLTPDVTLDLSRVTVQQVGKDRVGVAGARGHAAPAKLKATACFIGDWLGEAEISYAGPNAVARANLAIDTIRKRLTMRAIPVVFRSDIIGVNICADGTTSSPQTAPGKNFNEVRVRFAFSGDQELMVEDAVQEVNSLYCCGPAGGGGIRLSVRQRMQTQSYLVPRELVPIKFNFV